MTRHTYLVALGSNQRHPQLGSPREVVAAMMDLLDETLGDVLARSPIIETAPVGPSQRRYANATLVLGSRLEPLGLLDCLQEAEAAMGRERRGQRWRSRVIDLDIVLWSGGVVAMPQLAIPHPLFRARDFVLGPAAAIARDWRDPLTGLSLGQLYARLTGNRPVPR
ncbi:2-amino-4-hydroxy-6-hydroxymethyldihydropteridine diphosphokinase [Alteraurantiacibacter aquimixticola]|uniref:2-amino-4-hydroxy-6-hydroxymethyldihydropteridine pyrophosphokinase n=1 Tax=Alteraurantiacibacter aquimixticola TaxID=2489173 RepID=A0A4T3EZG6_9SPHN|nr:2-amino-4-hydroxy-6-hydroxymethyldihydropteridine diphosphokinase [Alteraurantiacibacter aquimixticola]TIX49534.1 2-amino-4-hydroxy-6-hydroxymethyldihydropteridine diphosphokinase [Alteraurantiacibacter aquimixticola]